MKGRWSIGELRNCKKTVGKKSFITRSGGRHVVWKMAPFYDCIRPGSKIYASDAEINEIYKQKLIDESYFWIFRHKDTRVQRSEITPLYEALYKRADGQYVIVQKCHLAQAYNRAKRTRHDQMWELVGDDPYWVDRYAFRKTKQKLAKKRYESK